VSVSMVSLAVDLHRELDLPEFRSE
jgi:hypothetical protein